MPKRRTFIKQAAVAGVTAGALAAGASPSHAEEKIDPRKPFRRTSRFRDELVTIGIVCGSRNSGHVGIWGQTWNPDDTHIRTTGMNCRYVWCLKDEDKQFFRNTWGFETKKSPEESFDILEKTAMFLMAFKSVLDKGGAPVRREELEGWELMPPRKNDFPNAHTVGELRQIARVFGGDYEEP